MVNNIKAFIHLKNKMSQVLDHVIVIVVAVNYADKLKYTLPQNVKFFHKYIVITSDTDVETHDLCAKHHVTCHVSTEVHKNGAKFNKSGLIHDMQLKIHKHYPDAWVLLLDADMMLPSNFPELFHNKVLNKNALYSLKRKDFNTYDDFVSGHPMHDYVGRDFMGFMHVS